MELYRIDPDTDTNPDAAEKRAEGTAVHRRWNPETNRIVELTVATP